jgi:uncharacterized protein YbbK (DUF523 family)
VGASSSCAPWASPSARAYPIAGEPPIRVQPLRTEHTHRTSPDEPRRPRHIGTYALGSLYAQIAGSVLRLTAGCRVVLCGSGGEHGQPGTGNLWANRPPHHHGPSVNPSDITPTHLPSFEDVEPWPDFTPDEPLKVLVSACITGVACGSDATAYGAPYPHTSRLLQLANVTAVPFCPEDFAFGTPRDVPDIHGGDGFDVLDGRARVVMGSGEDCTAQMMEAADAMLTIAQREAVQLALLMDISAACGSQVIYAGDRTRGVYQRGQGVAAALLIRHDIPVVSQRDYKTLGHIMTKLDPTFVIDHAALDHHETDWYMRNLNARP